MNNNKGFTLVEIILSIAILGLIAVSTLPLLTFGYVNLLDSSKFTMDTVGVQQDVEQLMEIKRDENFSTTGSATVEIFGKDVKGHLISENIPSTGSAHGHINVFQPKNKVVYTVPEVEEAVVVKAYRDGIFIPEDDSDDIFPLATPDSETTSSSYITFEANEPDVSEDEFLLNVYRWYMSPVTSEVPSKNDLIIIKEWNEARTPLSFEDSDDFTYIPNVEEDYDELDFKELYSHLSLTEIELAEKINERFSGRYFYYSVTPYSAIGRVGIEKISQEIIATNKITSINDITATIAVGEVYYPWNNYPSVEATMLNGITLNVPVSWTPAELDISEDGEKVSHGTVVGYPPGVKLTLTVEIVNVTGFDITPDSITLNIGENSGLPHTFTPANATEKGVTWTSSNPAVATVDSSGNVEGVTLGTATITGTTVDGGFTDTCVVTVEIGNLNGVTINGIPSVGNTLNSALDPLDATGTATYQWQRAYTDAGPFTNIAGATSNTYTLVNEDAGKYIRVEATGTVAYQGTVVSDSMEVSPLQTAWISASGIDDSSGSVQFENYAYVSDNNHTWFNSGNSSIHYTFNSSTLPNNAIIKGIEVSIEAKRYYSSQSPSFNVTVFKDSSGGTTHNTGILPSSDNIYPYGSLSDLWGFGGWTGEEVNDKLRVRIQKDSSGHYADLDHLQIRIHYILP